MFLSVLLFLIYTNIAEITKIEDISICINDTDCSEAIDLDMYTNIPKVEDPSLQISNDTEQDNMFITAISTEISSNIDANETEQPEIQSTLRTISSSATHRNDNKILILKKKEICECDLTKFSCDINCCCDMDCNHFHLSAFSHCQDYHVDLYDSRYCYNRNFIQRNNTPFIFERLANNLFCILYDNLPYMYNAKNDLALCDQEYLWKMLQMKNYKWNMKHRKVLPKFNFFKYYQHGDTLLKLHDKSVGTIEFLQSGFTGICSFKKILKYLENWKDRCIQNDLTNNNPYLFPTTFNNFTIIKSLLLFNNTFTTKQTCRDNTCLPIRTHYCLKSFSVCNRTRVSGFCMNSTCTNIVKGLKYIIGHNGSAGIHSIDAYFNIGNAFYAFYQYFEIEYYWIDSNKTKVFARSGNPGYMMGKPIIIGISHANASNDILFNRTNGFLTLPLAGKNGECDKINRHTIIFGEDIRLACSVKLFIENFTTTSCAELQNLTMRLLLKDFFLNMNQYYNSYVSKLGNFSSKNVDDWLQIVFDRIPRNIVTAHTIGKQILCSGLITSMHLNILYSILSKPKTSLTNYEILSVGITFNTEEDVSWPKCTLRNCTDILHINVISYVNFYDISKPFTYHFAGGSNLDITLPYDFFYPFLNGSKNIKMSSISILLVIYVHIIFIYIYI
ncbi:hypothetical protein P5V15_000011 [Pogonomyrmex californicus]